MPDREFGDASEQCSDGAYCIAVYSAIPPCEHDESDECYGGDDKNGNAANPDFGRVECIAVGAFGEVCEQVVAPAVYWGE